MSMVDDEPLHPAAQAQLWNAGVPVGTPVLVAEGEPSSGDPHFFATLTRTTAFPWGPPRAPVALVHVVGRSAAIPLERVAVDARRVVAQPSLPGFEARR